MVKIAVNTRFLIKNKLEGIGWFTYESLKRITRQHPEHQFFFLFDRPFDRDFVFSSNVEPRVLFPPARHPWLWLWWFERSVPYALHKLKPDLFFSPDGYCSLRTSCRQLMVVHDLAFEHFGDHVNTRTLRYYRHYTPLFAAKANRIVTVSEFTRQDLIRQYKVDPSKIDVAWNGSNELFHPLTDAARAHSRNDFAGGAEYFVYAGAIQPRKNIINMLLAFDHFKRVTQSPFKFVIAGRNWNYAEAMNTHRSLAYKDDVIFHGHLSRTELSRLLGGAFCLVYVSLFEGFGIPIVEAMNCEVPVITSNVSSMPEVAGDAALFCDPSSVDDIAAAMLKMFQSATLRNELVQKARVRRTLFNWQFTADKLWSSMMKTVGQVSR